MHAAFMLTLKPGGLKEYTRRHDEIWPELVTELAANGVTQVTIFHVDSTLFVFSEIDHDKSWEQAWSTDIHMRWAEELEPYLELTDDGTPASKDLSQIFHLRPGSATQG